MLWLFIQEMIKFGLFYALANKRIHSNAPLDPDENWSFWTKPQHPALKLLFRSYPPSFIRKKILNKMLQSSHAEGIEAHYDISNDFYGLFLDSVYRFYSCADFITPSDTLEKAQKNKAANIKSLLRLSGKEKILDLGCGWGAMLKYLNDRGHQGNLYGFTLSKEQALYCVDNLGLDVSLRNFITSPFSKNTFDRIYSIGAMEHVKPNEIDNVYKKMFDALTPGGLTVHQFFSLNHESYPASMVMAQLFFPGSLLVLHKTHIEAAQNAGFKITYDSIHDYKPTLRAWYENLVKNSEKAIDMVGLHLYNKYMTFFPISWLFFQFKEADVHRIVLEKPLS